MVQASSLVQFLIVVIAAWLTRQQEGLIQYLQAKTGCSRRVSVVGGLSSPRLNAGSLLGM